MKAIYLQHNQLQFYTDLPIPQPEDDEVLLKIKLAGICGTDIALLNGYAGFKGVPGHEFVAEVVEVGSDVSPNWVGKRAIAEINQWCGECEQCVRKQFSHCLNRKVIGIRDHQGVFAEYLVVKANTLHVVPNSLSDQQAVFIEPLAAAFRIVEQLQSCSYQDVMLIGAGRLGQLIARVMVLQKKQIKVVVRHQRQRDLLQDLPLDCISEFEVEPKSVDVAIDATGHESGLALALKATRPQGVCVMKSSFVSPLTLDLTQLVIDEIELRGSRCGPFARAIDALENGQVETEPLIDVACLLNDYQTAFALAQKKGTMKVLLRPC